MLTAHTSFVAVHETVRNTAAPATDVKQPLPLPLHVSNLAVGARNVPEPGLELMLAVIPLTALYLDGLAPSATHSRSSTRRTAGPQRAVGGACHGTRTGEDLT